MNEINYLEKLFKIISTSDMEELMELVLDFSEEDKQKLQNIIKTKKESI